MVNTMVNTTENIMVNNMVKHYKQTQRDLGFRQTNTTKSGISTNKHYEIRDFDKQTLRNLGF